MKSNYFVYILTNKNKTVLYIGVTNSLRRRIDEHSSGLIKGFTQKYSCKYLIYYEHFNDVNLAISREKELKKWRREKKEALIAKQNPQWMFLNAGINSIESLYV
ncbi:MAG: GIY-YIG nuclease family protein [Bacteroidales bacterium]|jgi:putative endonuclease|nr:GIY-YIG nuclease family protein [Bacteroidales bacterium]